MDNLCHAQMRSQNKSGDLGTVDEDLANGTSAGELKLVHQQLRVGWTSLTQERNVEQARKGQNTGKV